MNLNKGEAHDRLQSFKQDQLNSIQQGLEDCIKKNPLSFSLQDRCPYIYVYAHPKQSDCGLYRRMLWQPRLTKPEPAENSYLFRVRSKTDEVEICWMIPPKHEWRVFSKGSMMHNEIVDWSINMYKKNKIELGAPHPDDIPDEIGLQIYESVRAERREDEMRKRIWPMPQENSSS